MTHLAGKLDHVIVKLRAGEGTVNCESTSEATFLCETGVRSLRLTRKPKSVIGAVFATQNMAGKSARPTPFVLRDALSTCQAQEMQRSHQLSAISRQSLF